MATQTIPAAGEVALSPAAAAIDRYLQGSLFLLVVTGFLTIAFTGRLDAASVVGVSIALALRAYFLIRNRVVLIPERWASTATLIYVLFYIFDLMLLSGSYVAASVHLVLFSIVVKLFSAQKPRDHLYLIILSFLAVLSASVLTVDTAFLASWCLFVVLAVSTSISLEMKRSLAAAGEGAGAEGASGGVSRKLPVMAGLLAVGVLVGGLGLFFLLPRLSAGYLSSYAAQNEFVSGFSESVQLGEIGRIQQSNTLVMHIQAMDGIRGPGVSQALRARMLGMRWRGVALSRFDGRLWSNPSSHFIEPALGQGRFELWRAQIQRHNALPTTSFPLYQTLRYRVVMEPIGTNVLFLAPVAGSVQARIRDLGMDENGAVFNLERGRMTESYEATSLLPELSAGALRSRSGDIPAEVAANYLQLPEKLDPRISDLARRIAASATSGAKAVSDYDKAATMERYLKSNFGYSLQMASSPPADPLAYFLFERKAGHCEYFASAMAVMLRTLGVATRVVNGFRTGEYNDLTDSYIVRGRDAHSWVEAYLPAYGWVSFDPTPPGPPAAEGGWSRMMLYMDAAREFWREWVINYDFVHQRTLSISATRRGTESAEEMRLWTRRKYAEMVEEAQGLQQRLAHSPLLWLMGTAGAISGLLLLMNLRKISSWARGRIAAQNPGKAPQLAASIWYERMVRVLARRGLRKLPTQTPAEFVNAIPEPGLRDSVADFTGHYEKARFGGSSEDAERLPRLYEELVHK
jgi:transglutaminase-like putative cysteine protease